MDWFLGIVLTLQLIVSIITLIILISLSNYMINNYISKEDIINNSKKVERNIIRFIMRKINQ